MTNVFVVVLNWNRKKDTLDCLDSLKELKKEGYKLSILIVDNASTDDSVASFKKFKAKSIEFEIIENDKNLGFAGGNNVGIYQAVKKGADYVLVLNNDTEVDKNLIAGLLETVKKKRRVGAISPKIYFAKGFEFHKKRYKKSDLGKVIWYAGGDVDWKNVYGTNHGVDRVDRGQYEREKETDFATGSCMFLSKKAIKEVGAFDEKYFMYLEDADLSQRLKKKDFKVLYSPKGKIFHKVAQSSAIGGELNDYFISRNRMLFGMRYAPLRTKFALFRESIKLLFKGRKWQKIGIKDFYLGCFGKGSWK